MSEAVRIARTGATKIINSKMEYNRSSLPRIVTVDAPEEVTLGDYDRQATVDHENEDEEEEDSTRDEVILKCPREGGKRKRRW